LFLKNLKLSNFRSYEFLDLELDRKLNIIYGKNAQGKTNIIEAINYFSTLKSHRFVNDRELIKYDEIKAMSKIEFYKNKDILKNTLKISLFSNSKRELCKNNCISDNSSFLGLFNSILFSPEDLNLIKGDKENRRRFLDTDICQLRPKYYKILKYYNFCLKTRNKILKGENKNEPLVLDVYTDKLVEFGSEVLIYRALFIERLKQTAKRIYNEISNNKEELEIKYTSAILKDDIADKKMIRENYYSLLLSKKNEEEILKTTVIGPHRDDVEFYLDGKNVKSNASQGQIRTIVLALKLSELIFIKEQTGYYPVLLLDDILSELDKDRQACLFSYINDCQTIITMTDAQTFKCDNSKIIKIENSKIV
jgi:DNA replication and repair protein RecF